MVNYERVVDNARHKVRTWQQMFDRFVRTNGSPISREALT